MPDESLPSTEEVLEATQAGTSTESQPEAEQSQTNSAKAAAITEDTVLEMDVGGEKQQCSVKDLREVFIRNNDYTQKTQTLAEQRKELETIASQMQQREQAFTDMMKDPQKILALAASQQPTAQQQPELADTDVPTVGTIKQYIAQERQLAQQNAQQQMQQMQQQQVVQQMEQSAKQAFEKIYDAIPDLKGVPFIEDTLKKMALEDKPDSLEKMQESLVQAGAKLFKTYGFKSKPKPKQEPSAKLDGIEPPGGSSMPPAPDKTYGQGKKIDWSELDKDAIAWMESGGGS